MEGTQNIPSTLKKEEKMFETLIIETQKVCNKCGELKNLDDFPIDKRNIGGHAGVCRQCKNRYYRGKYRENPKKYVGKDKIWKGKHPKLIKKYNKKYRETHKEHIKKLCQDYYHRNREKVIAKSKAYAKEHKDEIRIKKKIYRDSHKEEISEYNRRHRERKKLETGGVV